MRFTKVRDSILKAAFNSADVFCPNDIASFTDSSIGPIKQWFWNFGNGETSTQRNSSPPHYVSESNITYTVQIVVKDSGGCSDTAIKIIKTITNCYT